MTETNISGRPSIDIRGLSKSYGKTLALDGLDLTLHRGRMVGLMGPNGCGKTTLLKILGGALQQYRGQAMVAGHTPGPHSKARVSFLPDASMLPRGYTIERCLGIYRDMFADFEEAKARDMIGHFDLEPTMRIGEMSKGMREKAQIALTMSRRAEVFLLDEPISGVDPAARDVLLAGIVRDLDEDSLVVISTHLVHDLEPVLDTAVLMHRGRVVLHGDVDDLRAQHGTSLDGIVREVFR